MGNTKTYYLEGELLKGVSLEQFKEAVYEGFHSTYCVAEIVEEKGGYLGNSQNEATQENGGPYLLAAIHSYSMSGDSGPAEVARLFSDLTMHRLDADWSDLWACYWEDGKLTHEWRSEAPLNWREIPRAMASTDQQPTDQPKN